MSPAGRLTAQQKLEAKGWRRMCTYDEPRLSELVESYEELGYEVHVEPIHLDEEDGCLTCLEKAPERFRTIYVRKLREELLDG